VGSVALLSVAIGVAAGTVAVSDESSQAWGRLTLRAAVLADERAVSPWTLAAAAPPTPQPPAGDASAESPGAERAAPGLAATPAFFAPPEALIAQERECTGRSPDRFYEFYFTRAIYNERGGGFGGRRGRRGGGSWAVDYPKADCQFISVVQRLAGLDMFYDSNAISLDDPNLRRFPFLYALEVGQQGLNLSPAEAQGLRDYLAAGGFLVVDDFWGTREWNAFERDITQVLPEYPIVDIPMDHTVFKIFYTIDEVIQVPNVGNAERIARGFGNQTWEDDGYVPYVKGMYDENGRLMVLINWNTDLGDAWEWAEDPYYPLEFSTFAFEMGVNMILYSMTH
jgi:hypothetical protein